MRLQFLGNEQHKPVEKLEAGAVFLVEYLNSEAPVNRFFMVLDAKSFNQPEIQIKTPGVLSLEDRKRIKEIFKEKFLKKDPLPVLECMDEKYCRVVCLQTGRMEWILKETWVMPLDEAALQL